MAQSIVNQVESLSSRNWNPFGTDWQPIHRVLLCQLVLSQSVQSLSCVQLFETPWTVAYQASLSTQTHVHRVDAAIQPSHPLSSPSPALNFSFQMNQLFASGGQSIGVSALASVLPMYTQDWSLLEWADWISLQSKGLSRVFSNTTVQKHQFFGAQLSSQSNSHIHIWLLEKP